MRAGAYPPFVMITRWSGEDKPHPKNCGESTENEKGLVEKWKANCQEKGCQFFVGIEDGTTLPQFILSQLNGKCLVYVDYDTVLNKYPSLFEKAGVDFMATAYNIDPRFFLDVPPPPPPEASPEVPEVPEAPEAAPEAVPEVPEAAPEARTRKNNPTDPGYSLTAIPEKKVASWLPPKRKRGSSRPTYTEMPCFDPYVFQPTGGLYYFADTPGSRELLEAWDLSIAKNPGKDIHDVLSLVFNLFKFDLPLSYIQLPSEYLSPIENKDAIIRYNDCLPKNTEPPDMYSELTIVDCKENGGTFYEYVYFDNAEQVKTLKDYIRYVEANNLYEVVPFSEKYGDKSQNIEINEDKKKERYRYDVRKAITEYVKSTTGFDLFIKEETYLNKVFDKIKNYKAIKIHTPVHTDGHTYEVKDTITNRSVKVGMTGQNNDTTITVFSPTVKGGAKPKETYSFEFVIEEDVSEPEKTVTIPGFVLSIVLAHLDKNQDVFFVPPGESDELLKEKAALKLDFVATNTSINDRKPEFDIAKPMFFSASNKALRAIIAMCLEPADISKVFGGSHQFLTQIRCFWVHVDNS